MNTFVPIFVPHSGEISFIATLVLYLGSNIVMLLIYLILTLIWLVRKDNYLTWSQYVLWSDFENAVADITTMCFVIINGVALMIVSGVWVTSLIFK